ncbi:MAG: AraC family transcriptional regulator [Bacteroidetes bacterium]|nr:AraC family transcriptional regulator [Bacteroidota bacterium]
MKVSYYTLPPPPALAGIVRFFWVFEIQGIDGNPYIYRSMADGCAELVFHYKGPFTELKSNNRGATFKACLHSQTMHHRRFEVCEDFGIFGAYIFPFALPRLFGYPASALANEMPDLVALMGQDGRILEERILSADDNLQRTDILSLFLLQRLAENSIQNQRTQRAVQLMIHQKGQIKIDKLADSMGISQRQLERTFKEYAGFSPKTFARILRFQSATNHYGTTKKTLTEIALDCGYYDQSHFIHDFSQFSGYTPSEYFLGVPEGIEYREI